jgi:Domain of unknown function (DUF4263)
MKNIKQVQIDILLKILDSPPPIGRQKEQVIQEFLEEHSDMIPLNHVLNHQVLYDFIFSKFPINSSNISDFMYITKSSVEHRIVFIELENSDKSIFTSDLDKVIFSAEFNAALQQVRNWKILMESDKDELLRNLKPMLQLQRQYNDPISFRYQLIIGRSVEYINNENRKRHIANLEKETGINILTYDSLISWYKNSPRNWYKNIVRLDKDRYSFKRMDAKDQTYFAHLSPSQIILTDQQKAELISQDYQISDWENNILLTINLKYSTLKQLEERGLGPYN